jgi:NAD(P)H-hydrate epimerase
MYSPKCGYEVLQNSIPEAMVIADPDIWQITQTPHREFDVIGIGPGIGTSKETVAAFEKLLQSKQKPMVIDADALNILSYYPDLQALVPKNSILTPHLKEFERLFGVSENSFERVILQRQKAQKLGVIIVLKGAHSSIALPNGKCFFNITGNPGMATAGSGDVLTGMITSLLAQQYSPENAALLGVFLHGMAGDFAAATQSEESLIASDIINYIGKSFENTREVSVNDQEFGFFNKNADMDFDDDELNF